jgi:hypothetical protein
LPSGMRNTHCNSYKVRSSSGLCHDDSLRATSCLPTGSDLL